MDELVEAMAISMGFAFTFAIIGIGIWFLIDENKRKKFVEKQEKKLLTTKEWFAIVFGIILVVQGSATITIFASTMNTDFGALMSGIGMFLIIGGVLLELRTHTNFKKTIIDLEKKLNERIDKLEESSQS